MSSKPYFRSSFWRGAIPFLGLMLIGSFGLRHFTSIRYQFRKVTSFHDEMAREGVELQRSKSLEEHYEEYAKEHHDNWQNVRGPRPWEDNTEWERVRENKKREREQKQLKGATAVQ